MHMKPNNKVQVVIQISENEIPRSHLLNFVQTLVGNDDDDELMLNVLRCHETY